MASSAKTTSSLIMGNVPESSNGWSMPPQEEFRQVRPPGASSSSAAACWWPCWSRCFVSPRQLAVEQGSGQGIAPGAARCRAKTRRSGSAATPVDTESLRYRRVTVRGTFEPQRQILIDNRVHHDQAGYHVVTPCALKAPRARSAARTRQSRLGTCRPEPGDAAGNRHTRRFRRAAGDGGRSGNTFLHPWCGTDRRRMANRLAEPRPRPLPHAGRFSVAAHRA